MGKRGQGTLPFGDARMSRKQVTLELTEGEETLVRQALAFHEELQHVARTAPHGKLLLNCETAVLSGGRELQRSLLERVVQDGLAEAEKKGRRAAPARAAVNGRTGGSAAGDS